ncbi:hypothetical protein DMH04_09940 [Kibdelosporangium aridum]|uniref:Uncharacterized protein n=1 Tax=Kibdelosporangium aridum TaxID=2030 RepID=A0A428ZJ65_KIBAR|nr:hypothetical protein DMH04_09940 [Kibdelosporangium aridum]
MSSGFAAITAGAGASLPLTAVSSLESTLMSATWGTGEGVRGAADVGGDRIVASNRTGRAVGRRGARQTPELLFELSYATNTVECVSTDMARELANRRQPKNRGSCPE